MTHKQPIKRVLVVGLGGVGGYYAAQLGNVCELAVVARGEHGAAVRANGLTLETPTRTTCLRPAAIYEAVTEARGAFDLVLVATKAYHLSDGLCEQLRAVAPEALVLSLLNGVESEAHLARFWPETQIIAGVSRIAAERNAPGVVQVLSGGAVELAPWQAGALETAEAAASVFDAAGVPFKVRSDAKRMLWEKLLWNAGFNGVCALARRTAGEVLAEPELRRAVIEVMREVVTVANVHGIALASERVEANIEVTEQRFEMIVPSMLQDVLAGRRLEHDALQGVVVRYADAVGVAVPRNRLLAALLRGLDASSR